MTIEAAISLLLALINHAQQISSLIQGAQTAGRTALNTDEWSQILASDATARDALVKAISITLNPPAPSPPPVQ